MRRILIVLIIVLCVTVGPASALVENEKPLADAGLDQTVEQGTTVVLDATGSRDPDGTIVAYEWTIETPRDRVITPAEATQPRTTFRATEPGLYRVTITVTDDDGLSTSDTLYVTVGQRNKSTQTERLGDSSDDGSIPVTRDSPDDEPIPETQNSGDQSDTADDPVREDTDRSRNDVPDSDDGTTPPSPIPDDETTPSSPTDDRTVEEITYVAEDIDMDVTRGYHSVNNNKLSGASGSKTVDYTEIERLVNAGRVFQQGFRELFFGRERQTYSFTTTNRSEVIYQNSSKNDINGYELDVFSDGPAVGLHKEYVDFRRISDRPIDDADVYRVRVVVQGEKGLFDYLKGEETTRKRSRMSIVGVINSFVEIFTNDYSSTEEDT